MSFRRIGIANLQKFLNVAQNVNILEKRIFWSHSTRQEYLDLLYEVLVMISKKIPLRVILKVVYTKKTGVRSKEFEDVKNLVEEEEEFIIKPFEIEEGVLECGKCGSLKTYSYTKQTRSGDESTTVFAICSNCNNSRKT